MNHFSSFKTKCVKGHERRDFDPLEGPFHSEISEHVPDISRPGYKFPYVPSVILFNSSHQPLTD